MLKNEQFGAAIRSAIKLKIAANPGLKKAAIARYFGVQPPSLTDWEKRGTISKDKLGKLFRYFSDVAGPSHWGMTEDEWPAGLTSPVSNETGEEDKPKESKTGKVLSIGDHMRPCVKQLLDIASKLPDSDVGRLVERGDELLSALRSEGAKNAAR
jgi:hypothetical protein